MGEAVIAAWVAGGFSLLAALIAVGSAVWSSRSAVEVQRLAVLESRRKDESSQAATYAYPLQRAAYDLQSRLYNALRKDFFSTSETSERRVQYGRQNTAYLFGQYLCWVEIIRIEIGFMTGSDQLPFAAASRTMNLITRCIGTDDYPAPFQLFAGEQRALAEAFLVRRSERMTCIGFGEYQKQSVPLGQVYLDMLVADIEDLERDKTVGRERLTRLQNLLVDLIKTLDVQAHLPDHSLSKA